MHCFSLREKGVRKKFIRASVYFLLKNLRFLSKKYTLALKNLLKGRFSSVARKSQ
jgi:hypothetical protein